MFPNNYGQARAGRGRRGGCIAARRRLAFMAAWPTKIVKAKVVILILDSASGTDDM